MVRTTKGPAEKSTTKPDTAPDRPTAEDRKMERTIDLDDETWDRVVAMARSQSISPSDAVRKALVQMYGEAQPTEAFNA